MTNSIIDGALADTLGNLLAQIADLTKQADAIKNLIKDSGVSIEGNLFRAVYSESNKAGFDKAAFVADLGQDLYSEYTKTSAVYSVKVTAR